MYLDIVQKKGDPYRLDGRLTVYACLDLDVSELITMKHPVLHMVNNGLLVAQGNYREQNSLKDFLKSELGVSLEEGLEQIIEKLEGLESALDPQKLREKIENFEEFEDMIPTPAKIVPFGSEEEILQQQGDVFFVGHFKNIGNANLSVNSFPILYQAKYREQELKRIRDEIEQLIGQIEKNDYAPIAIKNSNIDIEERILKDFIPNMLYSIKNPQAFKEATKQFRLFLREYTYNQDIEEIITTIQKSEVLGIVEQKLLELYAKKISAVFREDFAEVQRLQNAIEELKKSIS